MIGAEAVILRNIKIGGGAKVEANAVGLEDVSPYSTAVGNSAIII